MVYYYIAMTGIAIYFTSCFFQYSRTVKETDKGKVIINKLEMFRRPNMLHAFIFVVVTFLIYWLFV